MQQNNDPGDQHLASAVTHVVVTMCHDANRYADEMAAAATKATEAHFAALMIGTLIVLDRLAERTDITRMVPATGMFAGMTTVQITTAARTQVGHAVARLKAGGMLQGMSSSSCALPAGSRRGRSPTIRRSWDARDDFKRLEAPLPATSPTVPNAPVPALPEGNRPEGIRPESQPENHDVRDPPQSTQSQQPTQPPQPPQPTQPAQPATPATTTEACTTGVTAPEMLNRVYARKCIDMNQHVGAYVAKQVIAESIRSVRSLAGTAPLPTMLLVGPRGFGKTSFALAVANTMNHAHDNVFAMLFEPDSKLLAEPGHLEMYLQCVSARVDACNKQTLDQCVNQLHGDKAPSTFCVEGHLVFAVVVLDITGYAAHANTLWDFAGGSRDVMTVGRNVLLLLTQDSDVDRSTAHRNVSREGGKTLTVVDMAHAVDLADSRTVAALVLQGMYNAASRGTDEAEASAEGSGDARACPGMSRRCVRRTRGLSLHTNVEEHLTWLGRTVADGTTFGPNSLGRMATGPAIVAACVAAVERALATPRAAAARATTRTYAHTVAAAALDLARQRAVIAGLFVQENYDQASVPQPLAWFIADPIANGLLKPTDGVGDPWALHCDRLFTAPSMTRAQRGLLEHTVTLTLSNGNDTMPPLVLVPFSGAVVHNVVAGAFPTRSPGPVVVFSRHVGNTARQLIFLGETDKNVAGWVFRTVLDDDIGTVEGHEGMDTMPLVFSTSCALPEPRSNHSNRSNRITSGPTNANSDVVCAGQTSTESFAIGRSFTETMEDLASHRSDQGAVTVNMVFNRLLMKPDASFVALDDLPASMLAEHAAEHHRDVRGVDVEMAIMTELVGKIL
jgi:hypothetical protein